MRTRWLKALAGLLAIALVVTGAVATLARRDLAHTRDRAATLETELNQARSEADELASRLDRLRETATPTPSDDGTNSGAGEGPLGALDGAEGLLDALGGDVPGLECLAQPGGGGLADLFGGDDDAPTEPQALVDHIAGEVAELRELPAGGDIDAELLSAEQTARRVEQLLLEDYGQRQADTDRRLLSRLGVVAPGTDLLELQRELLSGQVAGFYVPSSGELVVRSTGDAQLSATDQITLAHEINHALTDRALELPVDDDAPEGADAQLAALSVVEGDASLVMNRWGLEQLSLTDQLSLATDPAVLASQEQLEQTPHYLAQELVFPYMAGLDRVCDAWLDGGWEAVDELYRDPPDTTAGVMFPERWDGSRAPAAPPELSTPTGWQERRTGTFGAAQLSWLFEAPGDATDRALSQPEQRASAWAGGTATVWTDESRSAVGLSLVDAGSDGSLCASVTAWYAAAFPETSRSTGTETTSFDGTEQDAAVACPDDQVRVGIAPTPDTAAAIAETTAG